MRVSLFAGVWVASLSLFVVDASDTFAQSDHKGLVGLSCVRTELRGDSDLPQAVDHVFRDLVRTQLPKIKVTVDCSDLVVFIMRTVHTSSKSAVATSIGIEVYRDVALLGGQNPAIISAQVWEDDYIYLASGPADEQKLSDSIGTILKNLTTHLRDDYLLAGNGS